MRKSILKKGQLFHFFFSQQPISLRDFISSSASKSTIFHSRSIYCSILMEEVEGNKAVDQVFLAEEKQDQTFQSLSIHSLPLLIPKRHFSQEPYSPLEEADRFPKHYSLKSVESKEERKIFKERIYHRVYQFLVEMIEHPQKCSKLIDQLEVFDKEFKIQLKKSKKTLYSRKKTFNNFSNSQISLEINTSLINGIKALKSSASKQDQNEVISLKLINSKKTLLSKNNLSSISDMLNIAKLYTLKDSVVLEAIQSANSFESNPGRKVKFSHSFKQEAYQSDESGNKQNECNDSDSFIQDEKDSAMLDYKEISILMIEEQYEKQSELFSSESQLTLKELDLSSILFTVETIQLLFDSPQPFFINFSLCILFKYLIKSKTILTSDKIVHLLGVSTLVAYKTYYDETIQGLIDHFAALMGLETEKVIKLERWFLQAIGYDVSISNKQYHEVMYRLISSSE